MKNKKEITRFAVIKLSKVSELMLRIKYKIVSNCNYGNTKISFLFMPRVTVAVPADQQSSTSRLRFFFWMHTWLGSMSHSEWQQAKSIALSIGQNQPLSFSSCKYLYCPTPPWFEWTFWLKFSRLHRIFLG